MTGAGSLSPCLQPVMEIRFNLFLSAASFERSTRMLLPVRYQFLGTLHAGRGTSQAIAMMQMLAEGGARGALSTLPARPRSLVRGDRPARGQPKTRSTLRAPSGFAAIPAAALDPPHRAASPAVPALIGSGSPLLSFRSSPVWTNVADFGYRLELRQVFLSMLRQPSHHAGICQQLGNITLGHRQVQIVDAIRLFD